MKKTKDKFIFFRGNVRIKIIATAFLVIICSCTNPSAEKKPEESDSLFIDKSTNGNKNLISGYIPLFEDGDINVVIEIPAGTLEKWEVDKSDGKLKIEYIDEEPRIIDYLGYPANYGMIPGTLLSEYSGGDGDPLDAIVMGPPFARGSVVRCKVIGVMLLDDRGEYDDKIIAVAPGSPLFEINSIEELDEEYPGITDILQLWFTNYKGPAVTESEGFGDRDTALDILKSAIEEYLEINY